VKYSIDIILLRFTVLVGCLTLSIHGRCSVTCVSRGFTSSVWDMYHLGQTIGHVNIVYIITLLVGDKLCRPGRGKKYKDSDYTIVITIMQ